MTFSARTRLFEFELIVERWSCVADILKPPGFGLFLYSLVTLKV